MFSAGERLGSAPGRDTDGLRLLVMGEDRFSTHVLPREGRVTIGTSPGCDVRIADPDASPEHAAIHLGRSLAVEDLGSASGTRLRESPLLPRSPTPFAAGDVLRVGSVLLMVDRPRSAPPRRILTHGSFEVRLEEECHRAERAQRPFALLRIACDAGTPDAAIEEVIAASLRLVDVVGYYGPADYEVLLCDTPAANAPVVMQRLEQKLTERGLRPRLSSVTYPRDAQSADALLDRLRASARGDALPIAQPSIETMQRMVERVAASDISVLVFGETGVGKELLAQRIHHASPRAKKPFLTINCAALSESLLESELFGHERGSFTGAQQAKAGLFENASGGTVLLDEVGEMPLAIQAKLLRVLEERRARRVGGLETYAIDVRFLAATNRDLEIEVERGTFRKDLFFRLNGISFTIPPLRERAGEIEGLARDLMRDACRRAGRPAPAIGPEVLELFRVYPWPGNVRELRNVMERALVLCGDGAVGLAHVPVEKMSAHFARRLQGALPKPVPPAHREPEPAPGAPLVADGSLRSEVEAFERQRIVDALSACAGNQAEAAKVLRISRRTLVKRLAAYDIPRPRKRTTRGAVS